MGLCLSLNDTNMIQPGVRVVPWVNPWYLIVVPWVNPWYLIVVPWVNPWYLIISTPCHAHLCFIHRDNTLILGVSFAPEYGLLQAIILG